MLSLPMPRRGSGKSRARAKMTLSSSTSTIHRRLGLQVILLAALFLVNRRMLVSYHRQSSSSSSSSSSGSAVLLMSSSATTAEDFLPQTVLLNVNVTATNDTTATIDTATSSTNSFKFYILNVPSMTTALLARYGQQGAVKTYARFFNEDRAEMWLHRGLSSLSYEQGQTMDADEADVFFIPGYLHYRKRLIDNVDKRNASEDAIMQQRQQPLAEQVISVLVDKTKPHVLLIPTRDPTMNRNIGLKQLVKRLQDEGVNLYSVGFERNSLWQTVDTNRIIPIPYVVQPLPLQLPPPPILSLPDVDVVSSATRSNNNNNNSRDNGNNDSSRSSSSSASMPTVPMIPFQDNRTENFVFLSAHPRPNAMPWSGCNRSMVAPLIGERDDMDIRIVGDVLTRVGTTATAAKTTTLRMTQKQYNHRMQTSDYCLILCGDTPTSRSLASAMMAGCIPLFVGSWWRGLCEPPCKLRYGWTIANQPHFPFANDIDWNLFPELNETQFAQDPLKTLHDFFNQTKTTHLGRQNKHRARAEMKRVQTSWIYGWGNPVRSTQFGDVYSYLWKSTLHEVGLLLSS